MMMDEPKAKSARDYEEEFNALCLKNEQEDDGEEYRLYHGAAVEEEEEEEEGEEEDGWIQEEEECFMFDEGCLAEVKDRAVNAPEAMAAQSMDLLMDVFPQFALGSNRSVSTGKRH